MADRWGPLVRPTLKRPLGAFPVAFLRGAAFAWVDFLFNTPSQADSMEEWEHVCGRQPVESCSKLLLAEALTSSAAALPRTCGFSVFLNKCTLHSRLSSRRSFLFPLGVWEPAPGMIWLLVPRAKRG